MRAFGARQMVARMSGVLPSSLTCTYQDGHSEVMEGASSSPTLLGVMNVAKGRRCEEEEDDHDEEEGASMARGKKVVHHHLRRCQTAQLIYKVRGREGQERRNRHGRMQVPSLH